MLLELKNLTKDYTRGSRSFSAVAGVDFNLKQGDFVSIIGRSGSGKSTMVNMIAGLTVPTSGQILLEGDDIYSHDDDYISKLRNTTIGFIPQQSALIASFSIIENVCLPFYLYEREGDPYGRAMILLEQLGIEHLAKSYPKELSGGERKRVLIARAMMNEPKLLIADEPTADLDVESTRAVMEIFKDLNQKGVSMLIVTHELDTTEYAENIYTMASGELTKGKHLE